MIPLLLLGACSTPAPPDSDVCVAEVACSDGYEARADGLCYEAVPAACPDGATLRDDGLCYAAQADGSLDAAVGSQECRGRVAAGDALDLALGCVDGVCVGAGYPAVRALWGEPDACERAIYWYVDTSGSSDVEYLVAECAFGPGRTAFLVERAPEDVQPSDAATVDGIWIDAAWQGADPNGIRPGVSLGCMTRWLGPPVGAELQRGPSGELLPVVAWWSAVVGVGKARPWDDDASDVAEQIYLWAPAMPY